jgi:CheY-like chemotaxis protein
LVIDDDQLILDTAAELLQMEGHRVLVASSGEDGLAMARAARLDLILVDYHMPAMNGLEVAQRLKADAETRRIPLVALTSGTAQIANELIRAGCVAFIPKPFEPSEFLALVAEILNETAGRSRPSSDPRTGT